MGRQLRTSVYVSPKPGSSDAGFLLLSPGDEVPDWAVEQIGDHAWADTDEVATPTRDPGKRDGGSDGPPAKAGKGSAKEAWVDYAAAHGVAHDQDATREDIIAACEAAGVATEAQQ
jgi:hypothetical protein